MKLTPTMAIENLFSIQLYNMLLSLILTLKMSMNSEYFLKWKIWNEAMVS